MKPVAPSSTHSQFVHSHESEVSGIYVVTSAYGCEDSLRYSLITCWQLSFWEAIKLIFTRKIYVEQLATKLNPQKLSISRSEVNLNKVEATPLAVWRPRNE